MNNHLVIIHDFDIVSIAFAPNKADTKLIVDANAMLANSVAGEWFKPVAGWNHQFHKLHYAMQDSQFL